MRAEFAKRVIGAGIALTVGISGLGQVLGGNESGCSSDRRVYFYFNPSLSICQGEHSVLVATRGAITLVGDIYEFPGRLAGLKAFSGSDYIFIATNSRSQCEVHIFKRQEYILSTNVINTVNKIYALQGDVFNYFSREEEGEQYQQMSFNITTGAITPLNSFRTQEYPHTYCPNS